MRIHRKATHAVLRLIAGTGFLGLALTLIENASGQENDSGESALKVTAADWPEASAMFHRDPDWLGGDDAYSVDLGEGRVAWFFGDSFVAPMVAGERRGTTMVRNSVGLQTNYDPTTATFETFWREVDGKPKSFIADEDAEFFWPGGSILLDGKILMFMMRARDAKRKLAFATTGWGAVLIGNIDATPDRWDVQKLNAPQNQFGVLVGSASLIQDGEHLVAFSVSDKDHDVYLLRWRREDAAKGDLAQPQWWAAERGWVDQGKLDKLPPPVMKKGQTEFTVHFSSPLACYVQFQFEGFPLSPISFRSAQSLTGPWSGLKDFYRPREIRADESELMLYAAKAHPEQKADGLALTYCSNLYSLPRLIDSPEVYYPRFLKVKLNR